MRLRTRLLIVLTAFLLQACERAPQIIHLNGHVMGTTWSAKVVASPQLKAELQQGVQATLDDINDKMSTYQASSEISRFNQLTDPGCLEVSGDTLTVINTALKLSEQTQGAFDITVGPLVNLWGFGPDFSPEKTPTNEDLTKAKALTGYTNLSIEGKQICKAISSLYVDLSAIAKGYGVDAAARYIEQQGHHNYLVEVGGELVAKGQKPQQQDWRIGIETPRADRREVFENTVVPLRDIGAATSGDYRNYFEEDGIRYSHTIDPRSGAPIRHTLASVTVLAPNSMLSDGWATAFMVLGPEDGLKLANTLDFPVLMLVKAGEGFESHSNSAYQTYMAQDRQPEK